MELQAHARVPRTNTPRHRWVSVQAEPCCRKQSVGLEALGAIRYPTQQRQRPGHIHMYQHTHDSMDACTRWGRPCLGFLTLASPSSATLYTPPTSACAHLMHLGVTPQSVVCVYTACRASSTRRINRWSCSFHAGLSPHSISMQLQHLGKVAEPRWCIQGSRAHLLDSMARPHARHEQPRKCVMTRHQQQLEKTQERAAV